MRNRIFPYILSASLIFVSGACNDLLDVEPTHAIDSRTALTSMEAVEAATNGVYARLRAVQQYGRDLVALPELLSDNAVHSGRGTTLQAEASNSPGAHLETWETGYAAINEANLILEALGPLSAPQSFKNSVEGQVRFLRALFYHNLVKVYAFDPTANDPTRNRGGVPLVRKGVIAVGDIDYAKGRDAVSEVYRFIYEDLTAAYQLLEGTDNARAPHFATRGAVAAFFSRVALYNGDYNKVISEANLALKSGVGQLQPAANVVASWRTDVHPESMFEVAVKPTENIGTNESLRATFTTRVNAEGKVAVSYGHAVVSDALLSDYEAGDVRKELIWKGLGNNSSKNEMTKFFSRGGVKDLDNIPVIRVAELYLNRAEAYVRLDQAPLALEDLNTIRVNRGLPAVSLSGEALYDEILKQRRVELAFEGHRWFDMKRLARTMYKETGNIPHSSYRILARIPFRERNANSNIAQNVGY
ncbi:RagB/SusD family nutrient uptake outer membrane protein [Rufibacter quisquiliarum]|uniref:RagB/SusD family nutrient uptake outer membrane protein n=2 Tax=Rufibacter quisquiliarum TaxID=1549639 RepID=A0A839GX26_9BACT|nr:RagB/SusD family nutrient uptake outer membrane protein [Rufibacter quisquiliarum]MBA9079296.1 hypothetical protein [Rufibacter quisquiliarum]